MGKTEVKKYTAEELLAAELAKLRMVPGNEALKYAGTIIKLVHKFEDELEPTIAEQLAQDDMDIEELLKNDKAIMEGIVSMSKLVTGMHDTIKRHFEASMFTEATGIPVIPKGDTSDGDKAATFTS